MTRGSGHPDRLAGRKTGLLTNARWLTADFRSAQRWVLDHLGTTVLRLFTPEHGPWGEAGPGESVGDATDPETGAPVVSLYGPRQAPRPADLEDLELLVVALPDVGCRAWTYLSTTLETIRGAAAAGVEVLVLDRPNPLGASVEGLGVDAGCTSFVAAYDVPLRHGLTAGQLAGLFAREQGLPSPATLVVPPPPVWVAPSPNLPTAASALAFAGTVLIEGTNLSEGRGTTRPFQLIGAPWLDAFALAEHLTRRGHPGLRVRPSVFTPASHKHEGRACAGVELFIADPASYPSLPVALSILEFSRRHPAFETNDALDRLWGGPGLRRWLAQGAGAESSGSDGGESALLAHAADYQAAFASRTSQA